MLVREVVRFVVQIVVYGDASECVEVELISQFQIMEKRKWLLKRAAIVRSNGGR